MALFTALNPALALRHVIEDLPTAATATFLALFPIVNPLGGIPLFFSLTSDFSREERNRTALRTALYVLAILVVFMLFGRFVLSFFGISLSVATALQLAGINISTDVVNLLPFIAIMVALVAFARRSYLPPALALPYVRGAR